MKTERRPGRPISNRTRVIFEYLDKFPNAPSRTLARKIYNENPAIWTKETGIYTQIRYYRGQLGDSKRKELATKKYLKPLKVKMTMTKIELPDSYSEKRKIFEFPTNITKLGIFGDVHIPYHDNDALEIMFEEFKKEKIKGILINGDLLDFYQLSTHEKDPRKANLKEELDSGQRFFAYLRDQFPNIPIYYIIGNHENRLQRYLRIKASELLDIDEFRLDVLLQFGKYTIEHLPYRSKVHFGNYLIEHGDKIRGAGGVVPGRTALMRVKRNCIVNHFHKSSNSLQKIYGEDDDKTIHGYSIGCMCELEPEYLEINEWNHGFAILTKTHKKGKSVSVRNYKIVNGIVV